MKTLGISLYKRAIFLATGGCLVFSCTLAQAGNLIANINDFSGVDGQINFEVDSGQDTLTGINNSLSGIGTFSISSGTIRNTSGAGLDGGGVFGPGHLFGGLIDYTITFDPNQSVDSIGFFVGGIALFNESPGAVGGNVLDVTYDDGTIQSFSAQEIRSLLPVVDNNAPSSQAINGFIGVDGDGQLISSFRWLHNRDFNSVDDIIFGTAEASGTLGLQSFAEFGVDGERPEPTNAVPEPLTILGAGTAIAFGTGFKRKLAKALKK